METQTEMKTPSRVILEVWWWIAWRVGVFNIATSTLLGFLIASLHTNLDYEEIVSLTKFIKTILSIGITILFFHEIIGKQFGEYTLELKKT